MQKVTVKIKGIAPLLVHKFMEQKDDEARQKDQVYDPVEDAEKALYKNKSGCFAPSTWIEACLRDTAKTFKKGRGSLKNVFLSSVFIDPDEIPLNKKTYDEIDKRPVVIQRNRIVRSRPKFNTWELEFSINYDETRLPKNTLKQVLEEAGQTKGIGDYRPKFGRFEVVKFA